MPFVFALTPGETFPYDQLSNPEEDIVRFLVGHDDATSTVYSGFVALPTLTAHPPTHRELIFGLTETSVDGEVSEDAWISCGLQTKAFLTGEDRKVVLGAICAASHSLLTATKPEVITMVTAAPSLPAKALTKYEILCNAIRTAGYTGGSADSYHGANIWMFMRSD